MARDLARLSSSLLLDDSGIWIPRSRTSEPISFPERGHEACLAIEDTSFWFEHRNRCIFEALKRETVEGPLLDVGGGNGMVSQWLERQGLGAVLLEPGPEGARNGRERGLGDVVCATLEDAAFSAESFGAAGVFDVIEHVSDDEGLLRQVRRVLRPGGTLCVTVPAYRFLWSAEDELAGHFRRYTLGRLRTLLGRAGFEVRYLTYFFSALVLPVFFLRSLRYRLSGKRQQGQVMESAVGQHTPSPVARKAMGALLDPELRMIRGGWRIPVGTSLLAVAKVKPGF